MDVTTMDSFNKLANLHSVFFKKAGPGDAGILDRELLSHKTRRNLSNMVEGHPAAAALENFGRSASDFADRAGLTRSPQDQYRRMIGLSGAYGAATNMLGGMLNPRSGGNPILAGGNRNVLVPGAMAGMAAAPDFSKLLGHATRNMFKGPNGSPDTFNDIRQAPQRKY